MNKKILTAITGVLTVDGKEVANKKIAWPPRVVPPKGAPKVLLIMTDDQGYGVCSHCPKVL